MVTGETLKDLRFKAYARDPLAHLVLETLKWKSWELPALYAATWILLSGFSILVYIFRDVDLLQIFNYKLNGLAVLPAVPP